MNCREKLVKAQSPVCQPGEVAEGLANCDAVAVGAVPGPDHDDGGEDVQCDQAAQTGEDGRGEEPGGFEAMEGIEAGVCSEERCAGDAAHGFGENLCALAQW